MGKPLVRHVVEALLDGPARPLIVVAGASHELVRASLHGLPVEVVVNEAWAAGMGTTIAVGMRALTTLAPRAPWVVIGLADQPAFSSRHVQALVDERDRSGCRIVATGVDGVLMPPVLFDRAFFPELEQLRGDAGARGLMQAHGPDVAVLATEALVDLDTRDDYERYLKQLGEPAAGPSDGALGEPPALLSLPSGMTTPRSAYAAVLSAFLLIEGVWGFFSPVVFGVLTTNLLHALIHVALGVTGIWAVLTDRSRPFLAAVGGLLLLVGALWFVPVLTDLLTRVFNLNRAVAYLNMVVGVLSLLFAARPTMNDQNRP